MKKTLAAIILLLAALTAAAGVPSMTLAVENSHHASVGVNIGAAWSVALRQSVYSEAFRYQNISLAARWRHAAGPVEIAVEPYGGIAWNGAYGIAGGRVAAALRLAPVRLHAAVNPHYDTGLGYNTCWSAGASVRVGAIAEPFAAYTTEPVYRAWDRFVAVGSRFAVGPLSVSPALAIPLGDRNHNVRVWVSMAYTFRLARHGR